MKIYVAGPYSDPDQTIRERNVEQALEAGLALLEAGHFPFIPHLNHYFDEWARRQGRCIPYETYLRWDAAFLACCDGLFFLGPSPGAERELELAVRLGKPVYSRLADASRQTHLPNSIQLRAVTPCHEMSHLSRP